MAESPNALGNQLQSGGQKLNQMYSTEGIAFFDRNELITKNSRRTWMGMIEKVRMGLFSTASADFIDCLTLTKPLINY